MSSINPASSNLFFNNASIQARTPPPAAGETPPNAGVTVEITPGEDNVSSGDRSANTAQVTITTPGREAGFEVSREQAVDRVERNLTRNLVGEALPGPAGGDRNPLLLAGLASGVVEREDAVDLAALRLTANTVETAFKAFGADTGTGNSAGSAEPGGNPAVDLYNTALTRYIRIELFSSIEPGLNPQPANGAAAAGLYRQVALG